ncbi:hypothetical protein E1B28_001020 [Marasmius oreades]|uniref:F-box domain-containing protein n=1 Tax=Marasmius oreades TaxID=181124 RepID=A0A9P8AEZ9_9AGAR|nr:uncharacterized protein E1B28_001020 [Marasmius oreades]KAG7099149.1 hypothetical protein E1B28_001020 [Marasmius oreades]
MSLRVPSLTITVLPPETLLEIFTWGNEIEVRDLAFRPFDSFMDPFMDPSFSKFCLYVASVCRSWRNLVLTTPSLWTNIVITIDNIEQAKLFLERSSPCPISLQVYATLFPQDIISTTMPYFSRLRSLTIKARSPEEAAVYSDLSSMPLLEEFCVIIRSRPGADPERDELLYNLIRNVTTLRSLTFKGILPQDFESLSWENLSFLNIRRFQPTYTQFRDLFRRATRLETLYLSTLEGAPDLTDDHQERPPIEAPSLKYFSVSFGPRHDGTECRCPLSLLLLNNLETLTVNGNGETSFSLSNHFSGGRASTSFTKLSKMRLVFINLTTQDVHFFRALNNVCRLELENVGGELSLNIAEPFEGLKPLPLLKYVTFRTFGREDLGWLKKRCAIQISQLLVEVPRALYCDDLVSSAPPPLTYRPIDEVNPPYFPYDHDDPWGTGINEEADDLEYEDDGFEDYDDHEDYVDYDYYENYEDYEDYEDEDFVEGIYGV